MKTCMKEIDDKNLCESRIVVVGSNNTDMVIRTPRLPLPGETVLGGEFMINAGGKGANQAVAVHKLGGNLIFVSKVGGDVFGQQTLARFENMGVSTEYIGVAEGAASGVALINVDKQGENSITVASGANSTLSKDDIDKVADKFEVGSILLMQLEIPIDTVAYAAQIAKERGMKVVLNPAPAPTEALPDDLLKNIDILIPNRTELETIARVESGHDIEDATLRLSNLGVDTIIVTMGSKGALICREGTCQEVAPVKVTAVDTTAAGDTFCGALCVAMAEGKSIEDSVKFANKAASITVTRYGAQDAVPERSEIDF